jgi:hypothetical protein
MGVGVPAADVVEFAVGWAAGLEFVLGGWPTPPPGFMFMLLFVRWFRCELEME